jgi:hypothetical protein
MSTVCHSQCDLVTGVNVQDANTAPLCSQSLVVYATAIALLIVVPPVCCTQQKSNIYATKPTNPACVVKANVSLAGCTDASPMRWLELSKLPREDRCRHIIHQMLVCEVSSPDP